MVRLSKDFMPKHHKDGYVFFEDQHYLRKVGTEEYFIYSEILAAREDMVIYDPFATNRFREIQKAPGVDDAEHRSNLTKEFIGLSREEIREAVKDLNRQQRVYWALDLLYQQMPIHDLNTFHPSRIDIMKIIGPPLTGADLLHSLEVFKANPNLEYLLRGVLTQTIPAAETESAETEELPNDPGSTPDPHFE